MSAIRVWHNNNASQTQTAKNFETQLRVIFPGVYCSHEEPATTIPASMPQNGQALCVWFGGSRLSYVDAAVRTQAVNFCLVVLQNELDSLGS